ncbi:Similar to hypothetical protein PTT_08201 [Pyrenophora teres f. teres 0-1]; acc. no. XP_003297709 [Pyronema omphalodes CBS 100304]|uniref:SET domain-containing protein n=1 Tax=Pyronema omphalodes (strain CBS 100304) TaxID=1076935 RepID=U4KWB0_PYROM|nr:Similar to hypothetical protein PTT_08201 [Pyrenophora teres f. teres 0-1]; acc. no. XP_003297709 [Pyronema omphalodes CBS 100304]
MEHSFQPLTGRYLVLRLTTPLSNEQEDALTWVVDENGTEAKLILNNIIPPKGLELDQFLEESTVILLKEPLVTRKKDHLALDSRTNELFVVVVDAPEHLPEEWDYFGEDSDSLLAEGRELEQLQLPEFTWSAILRYSGALRQASTPSSTTAQLALLHRARAYLKIGHYDSALKDCSQITAANLTHIRATLEWNTLYRLRRYDEAMQKLSQISDRSTKNTFRAKVQARIDESNGKFNFKALREAYRQGLQSDDHADYVSPSVFVNPAGSTERGLYTVKDVKAGELLLCTRAFSTGKGIEEVISSAIQELLTNPSRIEEFSKVARPSTGFPSVDDVQFVDGKLVIDQFESALYCEAFAISPFRDMIGNGSKPRGENSIPFARMNLDASALKSAFWIIPSVIRHSCIGNITYGSIGDFGIFRASKDIAAGEQVLMKYSASSSSRKALAWENAAKEIFNIEVGETSSFAEFSKQEYQYCEDFVASLEDAAVEDRDFGHLF